MPSPGPFQPADGGDNQQPGASGPPGQQQGQPDQGQGNNMPQGPMQPSGAFGDSPFKGSFTQQVRAFAADAQQVEEIVVELERHALEIRATMPADKQEMVAQVMGALIQAQNALAQARTFMVMSTQPMQQAKEAYEGQLLGTLTEGEGPKFGLMARHRPYKCQDCGHEQSISTNHTDEVSDFCRGCSWKGIGFGKTGHKIPALGGHTYRRFTFTGGPDDVGPDNPHAKRAVHEGVRKFVAKESHYITVAQLRASAKRAQEFLGPKTAKADNWARKPVTEAKKTFREPRVNVVVSKGGDPFGAAADRRFKRGLDAAVSHRRVFAPSEPHQVIDPKKDPAPVCPTCPHGGYVLGVDMGGARHWWCRNCRNEVNPMEKIGDRSKLQTEDTYSDGHGAAANRHVLMFSMPDREYTIERIQDAPMARFAISRLGADQRPQPPFYVTHDQKRDAWESSMGGDTGAELVRRWIDRGEPTRALPEYMAAPETRIGIQANLPRATAGASQVPQSPSQLDEAKQFGRNIMKIGAFQQVLRQHRYARIYGKGPQQDWQTGKFHYDHPSGSRVTINAGQGKSPSWTHTTHNAVSSGPDHTSLDAAIRAHLQKPF